MSSKDVAIGGAWRPRVAVAVAVGPLIVWRLAAFFRPSSMVALPDSLRLEIATLGLFFLACGVPLGLALALTTETVGSEAEERATC